MAKKRTVGRYPKAFRKMAVERLKSCDNIVALSAELGVHRRRLAKSRGSTPEQYATWRNRIYDQVREMMSRCKAN